MDEVTITLTKEELEIINYALMERQSRFLRDVQLYKAQKNFDAQKDCIDEWRKAYNLGEKIDKYI